MTGHQHICIICSNPFTSKKSTATMCSATCRKRAERQREREGQTTDAKPILRFLPRHYTILRWKWLHIEAIQAAHGGWMISYHHNGAGNDWRQNGHGCKGLDNAIEGALYDMHLILAPTMKERMIFGTGDFDLAMTEQVERIRTAITEWRKTIDDTPIEIVILNPDFKL